MPKQNQWTSRLGFLLAAAGAAIGLGNLWKFPYLMGRNGGFPFLIAYLIFIVLLGVPVMMLEMSLGRYSGKDPVSSYKKVHPRAGIAGFTGVLAAFIILSYYSVIGGWILKYIFSYLTTFSAPANFDAFKASPETVLWHFLFMAATALICLRGVGAIEKASKFMMPTLFVCLLAVIIRSVTLPGALEGLQFMFTPSASQDGSGFSLSSVSAALGQVFYSLSLCMGITITYGSYLRKDENIFSTAVWVVALDTAAALLGGLAIFPAVFAMQLAPDAGPGLIFNVLPATFYRIPGGMGWVWAGLFFLMMTIAALTSAAALLESGVTFLMDQFKFRRVPTVLCTYAGITLLGFLTCYSTNHWDNLPGVDRFVRNVFNVRTGSWFDLLDKLTSNWMLPLLGLLTVIFVGWIWGARKAGRELREGTHGFADENLITLLSGFRGEPRYMDSANSGLTVLTLWGLLVRYVAPVIMATIFIQVITA